jgi:4-hydroxybenzoate polyprenyltransferase
MDSDCLAKAQVLFEMATMRWLFLTLPFVFMSVILAAEGFPYWTKIFWICMAVFNLRNAGMYLNRLVDHEIDAKNPRTQHRALPSRRIDRQSVWGMAVISIILFEISAYVLGPVCLLLSPIPLILTILYPYFKRFSWSLHLVLGAIMAGAPLGAWVAIRGTTDPAAWLLTFAVGGWGFAFDVILDNVDSEFYRKTNLFSIPRLLGYVRSNQLALAAHLVSLLLFYFLAEMLNLGIIYRLGLLVIVLLLAYIYIVLFKQGLKQYLSICYVMNVSLSCLFFLFTITDQFVKL